MFSNKNEISNESDLNFYDQRNNTKYVLSFLNYFIRELVTCDVLVVLVVN